jgi:hypothetical protein
MVEVTVTFRCEGYGCKALVTAQASLGPDGRVMYGDARPADWELDIIDPLYPVRAFCHPCAILANRH